MKRLIADLSRSRRLFSRKRPATRDSIRSRRRLIETLEERRLLSATPTPNYVVNTTADELDFSNSEVSLREAIEAANTFDGVETITFAPSLWAVGPATIFLGGTQLSITDAVNIHGPGSDLVSVHANQLSRVIDTATGAFDVTVRGLTIRGGRTTGFAEDGAGIRFNSSGELTVQHAVVTDNEANTSARGAGIYSLGDLVIEDSEISFNRGTDEGGGIRIDDFSKSLTLLRSTVTGNETTFVGGGISADTVTIDRSLIYGNMAGDRGGAVFTFNGNANITNSTISQNDARGAGGGIYTNSGTVRVNASTVTQNTSSLGGGGIFANSSATLEISNSIVAGNGDNGSAPEFQPPSSSNLVVLNSLIGDNTGTGMAVASTPDGEGNLVGDTALPIDPMLGGLADNGGPTMTHALMAGSPAIDGANPDLTNAMGDQRGFPFARMDGGGQDMGAFELQVLGHLTVTSDVDAIDYSDDSLTLREAILAASHSEGSNTITFDPAVRRIDLTMGTIEVNHPIRIEGPGAPVLTIDGGDGADGSYATGDGFRLFEFDNGDTGNQFEAYVSGVTLTGGDAAGSDHFGRGGAIRNRELLTLERVVVTRNSAADGGGLDNSSAGVLEMIDSTIDNNFAIDSAFGGGIFNASDATLNVIGSTISGNFAQVNAGAIATFGDLSLIQSTVTNNFSNSNTGGIAANTSDVFVYGSIVSENFSGGVRSNLNGSSVFTGDYNLLGDGEVTSIGPNDVFSNTPMLSRLQRFGGPTPTHMPLAGSPALDASMPHTSELIANGGFETGDFTDWTVEISNSDGFIETNDGTINTSASLNDPFAPISGSFDAVMRTFGPNLRSLFQTFRVPHDLDQAVVRWKDRISNNAVDFSDPNQEYRVLIQDADGQVIHEVYSTNPGDPLRQEDPSDRQFDLTSDLQDHLGEIVRLTFEVEDNQGHFAVWVDDVSLTVQRDSDQRGGLFSRNEGSGVDIGSVERQTLSDPSLFVVTTDQDELDAFNGEVSLREAIETANGSVGSETITFDPQVTNIALSLGELVVADSVIIDGGAPAAVTVDAGGDSRVFQIPFVGPDQDVTLQGLEIRGGRVGDGLSDGGGVRFTSGGSLNVIDSVVTENRAGEGGGIRVSGSASLVIQDSVVSNNEAEIGGGLSLADDSAGTITGSTFSGNVATANSFRGGGAIFVFNADLTLEQSTLSGNEATVGGAIHFERSFSTINTASISHSTITGNRSNRESADAGSAALHFDDTETFDLNHSIVAGNVSGDDQNEIPGEIVGATLTAESAFNLIGDPATAGGTLHGENGNIVGQDDGNGGREPFDISQVLLPLADNGLLTPTHLPLVGSVVVDAGDPNFDDTSIPNDQRGLARISDGDLNGSGIVDIGAVERQMVNFQPTFSAPSEVSVREDSGPQLIAGFAAFDPGSLGESGQTPIGYDVSNLSNASLFSVAPVISSDGTLSFTAADDAFGSSTMEVSVQDSGGTFGGGVDTSEVQTLTITVTPVNDRPIVTGSNPPPVQENSGQITVPNFVSISLGPDNEADQSVISYGFTTADGLSLLTDFPDIDPVTGTLIYTPLPDVFGSATFEFIVTDSGGTNDGGEQTSLPFEFTITVTEEVVVLYDFGDAPSDYPVSLSQDGARHAQSDLRLGSTVDYELDGQPSALADADADDGVARLASAVSAPDTSTTASFFVSATGTGVLNAWIDFNSDNDWDDPGEQIAVNQSVSAPGAILSYTVPTGAVPGDKIGRFRFSSDSDLAPTGLASDGEVEDHVVSIGGTSATIFIEAVDAMTNVSVSGENLALRNDLGDLLFEAPQSGVAGLDFLLTPDDSTLVLDFESGDLLPSHSLFVDGNGGLNTVQLVGASDLDFTAIGKVAMRNIQRIDMSHGSANVMRLDEAAFGLLGTFTVIGEEGDSIVFDDPTQWRMGSTQTVDGAFQRNIQRDDGTLPFNTLFNRNWHNLVRAGDINNNGEVTAGDALLIINELGRGQYSDIANGQLLDARTVSQWPGLYYDQNGDDRVTALDALRVINEVARNNNSGAAAGEGEFVRNRETNPKMRESNSDQAIEVLVYDTPEPATGITVPSDPVHAEIEILDSSLDAKDYQESVDALLGERSGLELRF